MNKKIILFFTFLFIFYLGFFNFTFFVNAQEKDKIIFFGGQGCSHCAKVETYIQKNNLDERFNIEKKEIYFNQQDRQDFFKACEDCGIDLNESGVPLALIDKQCLIGDKSIIQALENKKEKLIINENSQIVNNQSVGDSDSSKKSAQLTLPLVLGAAIVDAINPCAFAVLIILMTTILSSGHRQRALWTGLAFTLAVYISYLLMGLGIYQALSTANFSTWFIKGIAVLALILGFLNLKDFFWYGGGGFIMEVPMSWRPKMKSLIHSITSPTGAFLIGFLVSLFLLPCTSGPYIVILGMLSQKENFMSALSWLLLYNAIFVLPMIIISLAVFKGLNPHKAEEARQKRLRILHLVAGILMIGMGVLILLTF